MLLSVGLAITLASPGSMDHGASSWRAELPPKVASIIAKVDHEVFLQDSQEKKDEQDKKELTPEEQEAKKLQERHENDLKKDVDLGKKYSEEVEKQLELTENEDYTIKIQSIGLEMAEIANAGKVAVSYGDARLNKFEYSFKVVKGKDVNAFSLPGGFIYVYEGLIEFAESDDEIAAVMAHEISHASFRHLATIEKERSKFDLLSLPLLVAAAMTRDPDVMNALVASQYAQQSMVSGWTVKAEESADYGALQYLSKSRYNPVAMLTFMERLAFKDKFSPKIDWGIFQTHPPSEQRARTLIKEFSEAKIQIERSKVTTTYSARSIPTEEGSFQLWFGDHQIHEFIGTDAKMRAAKAVINLNKFLDSVPMVFQLTVRNDAIYGSHQMLFMIDPIEAQKAGKTQSEMAQESAKVIRTVIFNLDFMLWRG